MYTIKYNTNSEIIIKNSKFICCLYKINSIDDITFILNDIKNIYKDATHYCYAYILNDIKKSSDDKEPSGTAGIPILKVLENNNLNNILAIVIRYFGGIKLGVSGLIRAYTKSVTNTLNITPISTLIKGYNIDIIFSYNQTKEIDYLLRKYPIKNKVFNIKIKYNLDIPKDFLEVIISNNLDYKIISEYYIEQ